MTRVMGNQEATPNTSSAGHTLRTMPCEGIDETCTIGKLQYEFAESADFHPQLTSPFKRTEKTALIDRLIWTFQRAVNLTPPDHESMPRQLHNLGRSFLDRFRVTGDVADIENAIPLLQRAVDLTPLGDNNVPRWLFVLGDAFSSRFQCTANEADDERAIFYLQRVLELNQGHRVASLVGLGVLLGRRFKRNGDVTDIENSILHLQNANQLLPPGHADITQVLNYLGTSWKHHKKYPKHLDQALANYRLAAINITGGSLMRLSSAISWATLSRSLHRTGSLDAFVVAIELLSRVAGLQETIRERHTSLMHRSNITMAAVATAITVENIDIALERLAHGRCLVWNQIQQLRTPIKNLHAYNSSLADRFVRVANELEGYGSRNLIQLPSSDDKPGIGSLEPARIERNKQVGLANECSQLLDKIHLLPDFHDFLRPSTTSTLLTGLPCDGTVVILNIEKIRCDALALVSGADEPLHIPLETFSHQKAVELQTSLRKCLKEHGLRTRDIDRAGRLYQAPGIQEGMIYRVLRELWVHLVKPVLDALAMSNSVTKLNRPRIWWCPTGPLAFLPIHAAGIYAPDRTHAGPCTSDFVISSYTPTISALISKLKSAGPTIQHPSTRILLISQPEAPNLSPIPAARTETRRLREMMAKENIEHMVLEDVAATTARVTEEMKAWNWVHFACHAIQDQDHSLKSGVQLHDGRLELLEMMKQHIPQAGHAFLSACQTGTGDEKLSEEAISIAAGMLALGYRGVVATLWSIKDAHGPEIAENFYNYILNAGGKDSGGRKLDGSHAAYALDDSIKKVREKLRDTEDALLTWVPYIHFGI